MKVGKPCNEKSRNSKISMRTNNSAPNGDRVTGNPNGNAYAAISAKRMKEPNWFELDYIDLVGAYRMCEDRVKNGDPQYRPVLKRIAKAMEIKKAAIKELQRKNKLRM